MHPPSSAPPKAESPATAPGQAARIRWTDDGIPVADGFDDPYYARSDGAAEAAYVFVDGTGLPDRLRATPGRRFQIAELGFGTGLNLLVTWAVLQAAGLGGGPAGSDTGPRVRYTSFEAFPMAPADRRRALSRWPDLAPFADQLQTALETVGAAGPDRLPVALGPFELELVIGDARHTLPGWGGAADAWYLDGFSPAKNPELWGADLMAQVARHTAPGGHFATYTAAGHVRRALSAAGFDVTRRPGFGHKRHMTQGTLR